jgi:hypothetical protein
MGPPDPHPDLLDRGPDPDRIRTQMSRIQNTAVQLPKSIRNVF